MSETDNPEIFSSAFEFMINVHLVSHDNFFAGLSLRTVFGTLSLTVLIVYRHIE